MNKPIAFIINARDGKPVSLSCVIDNKPYNLAAGHISFHEVIEELKKTPPDAKKIVSLMSKVEALKNFSQENVVQKGDKFYFQGVELKNSLVQRIQTFMANGLPWKPMFRFLQNLVKNPDLRVREESIFSFLENESLPLTPDGCFIGYKGAQGDFWSKNAGYHTMISGRQEPGTSNVRLFYGKGEKLRVPREEVCYDPSRSCARGIHVGSYAYAKNWAGEDGALVTVIVNPADVVSVPTDAREVMRVCALEVAEVLSTREPLKQILEPQFLSKDDEDAPTYHNKRDKNGRFVRAKK